MSDSIYPISSGEPAAARPSRRDQPVAGSHRLVALRVATSSLGAILLSAAALKAQALAAGPVFGTGLLSSRTLLIGQVEIELFLGLWLLSGVWLPYAVTVAQVLLLGFCIVSVNQALSGSDSCGCLGAVSINPWIVLVADFGFLVLLDRLRPAARFILPERPWATKLKCSLVVLLALALGIPMGLGMRRYSLAASSADEAITSDAPQAVLQPHNWTGKRFPLLPVIDIGPVLAHGVWKVVLYRPNCASCETLLEAYVQLARTSPERFQATAVAFIEVPSPGRLTSHRSHDPSASRIAFGRLDDRKQWITSTPVEIRLHEGIVEHIAVPGEKVQ